MTTAICYCRYSPRPEDECESLEFQEDYVRRYFEYRNIEVGKVIGDPDTSAWRTPLHKRKGGMELLALTTGKRPACQIVGSYRLDRLFRSVVDGSLVLAKWAKAGVAVHFAAEGGQSLNTSTAVGEFIINVLLARAQFEPALTSERTSSAMKRHMTNGRAMGSTSPYGMMEGPLDDHGKRTWIACPAEQSVIQRVVKMYAQDMSLRTIAGQLMAEGVPSRSGRVWSHGTIKSIVRRAMAAV